MKKAPGRTASIFILSWIALLVLVFVLVTIPAQSALNTYLPDVFWQLREMIYPLFYGPAIL